MNFNEQVKLAAFQSRQKFIYPLLLVFYEIAAYLSNDMYLSALPSIPSELTTTNSLAQMTLTAWFLGSVSLQLVLGPISDRFGRRPVLLVGGVFFVLSTLACALAPNIHSLLIARFVQGITVCSVVVAGYASIHELYEQKKAVTILAWMASIIILAPAFGPLVGGILLTIGDWRLTFWILVVWASIALLLLYKWMPETNHSKSPLDLFKLTASYRVIITNISFLQISLIFCSVFCGLILWIAAGPFLIINTFHYSPVMFGIFQIFIFGSFILGTQSVKYLMDRYPLKQIINAGLNIIFLSSFLIIASAFMFPNSMSVFILALMIFTGGCGLVFAPLQRAAMETCHEPMGARMAIFSTLMRGFGVLGGIMVVIFYNDSLQSFAYLLLGIIAVVCALHWANAFFRKSSQLTSKIVETN